MSNSDFYFVHRDLKYSRTVIDIEENYKIVTTCNICAQEVVTYNGYNELNAFVSYPKGLRDFVWCYHINTIVMAASFHVKQLLIDNHLANGLRFIDIEIKNAQDQQYVLLEPLNYFEIDFERSELQSPFVTCKNCGRIYLKIGMKRLYLKIIDSDVHFYKNNYIGVQPGLIAVSEKVKNLFEKKSFKNISFDSTIGYWEKYNKEFKESRTEEDEEFEKRYIKQLELGKNLTDEEWELLRDS